MLSAYFAQFVSRVQRDLEIRADPLKHFPFGSKSSARPSFIIIYHNLSVNHAFPYCKHHRIVFTSDKSVIVMRVGGNVIIINSLSPFAYSLRAPKRIYPSRSDFTTTTGAISRARKQIFAVMSPSILHLFDSDAKL